MNKPRLLETCPVILTFGPLSCAFFFTPIILFIDRCNTRRLTHQESVTFTLPGKCHVGSLHDFAGFG